MYNKRCLSLHTLTSLPTGRKSLLGMKRGKMSYSDEDILYSDDEEYIYYESNNDEEDSGEDTEREDL